MKNTFSRQLTLRAKRIFEKRSGRNVSKEEVEIFLEKLAQFGLVALRMIDAKNTEHHETHHPH